MDLQALYDTAPWDWPEETSKFLMSVLRDERASESDAVLAAELAGNFVVAGDEMADTLLAVIGNGRRTAQQRGTAAIALGPMLDHASIEEFDDPDMVPISEPTFNEIRKTLKKLFMDSNTPDLVRRRILEASVRAPEDWHEDAIREAYGNGDDAWQLTAVFCMGYVRGFDDEILAQLDSDLINVRCLAVEAAGNWVVEEAWDDVCAIVESTDPDKDLLLAAIGAVASIRPEEAPIVLDPLLDSEDEEIVEAVEDALMFTGNPLEDDDFDEDEFDEDADEDAQSDDEDDGKNRPKH